MIKSTLYNRNMWQHHEDTIRNTVNSLRTGKEARAVIVGGSLAHGFARVDSDVDILIVVSEKNYRGRLQNGKLHYYDTACCNYESGYVDGKYISLDFIRKAAQRGSEPARFAFDGAFVAWSKIPGLEELVRQAARYPLERKQSNIRRFHAQLLGWKWFSGEALRHNNRYLLNQAVNNMILFGGRMLLAHNETLYPYHKWFLRVLEHAPQKPPGIMELIGKLSSAPQQEDINAFCDSICAFTDWGADGDIWTNHFVLDSELGWLRNNLTVADI